MKFKTTIILLFCLSFFVNAQNSENYVAVVNGDSTSIELGKDFIITTKSGEKVSLKVIQSKIQKFSNDFVSFNYDKSYTVSCSKLEQGIEQCALMSSTGTGFLIQTYPNFNPTLLNKLMLNEITKESISYGYKKKEEDYEITLKSGQKLKGVKATLEYKGEVEEYSVLSYGQKDQGVLIATITMNLGDENSNKELINLFLKSLEYLK